jgi:uncharacterized YigZ family protein
MLFTDSYQTIKGNCEAELRERASRFIAYAYPIKTEQEAKEIIQNLKKEHYSAAHHCWALVLEPDSSFQKSSDDREPSGTAGRPILRTILAKNLTNILVVVERYFGGKLLGVPGLIAAYGGASEACLEKVEIVKKDLFNQYKIEIPFARHHELIRHFKQFDLKFYPHAEEDFEGIIFEVSPTKVNAVLDKIKENGFNIPKWLKYEK